MIPVNVAQSVKRSNSLGTISRPSYGVPGSPSRKAPLSPSGLGLKASSELYENRPDHIRIAKKIFVAEAVTVADLQKRKYKCWNSGGMSDEAWREERAPKDEELFLSGSLTLSLRFSATSNRGSQEMPKPVDVAKYVLRRVLHDGWLPDLKLQHDGYPLFNMLDNPLFVFVLLDGVKKILLAEPSVLRVPVPARIYGDVHGQFFDLLQFFYSYGSPDPSLGDLNQRSYCFLGDYVDRGFFSLEVCLLLFSLKLLYPNRVFLLRGNHETRSMSSQFGFLEELQVKLGIDEGKIMWDAFNDVFDCLSLTAIIGSRIISMHGGLGPNVNSIEQIAAIPKPLVSHTESESDQTWTNKTARDLLWSDPALSCDMGFTLHPVRGEGVYKIGEDKVSEFLKANNLDLVVRGHECVNLGFAFNCSGRVLTVFSAINYCGDVGNSGAIVDVSAELICQAKVVRHVYDEARAQFLVKGTNRLRESCHDLEDLAAGSDDDVELLCMAGFAFTAEKPLEISLQPGEKLTILNDENPDWLWVANAQGKQGYCPRGFVTQRYVPVAKAPAATAAPDKRIDADM